MSSKYTHWKESGIVFVLRRDDEYTSDYLPTRNGASFSPCLWNPKIDLMRYLPLHSGRYAVVLSYPISFFWVEVFGSEMLSAGRHGSRNLSRR